MAATPSLRIVKTMPFKGGTRQYSNRYHFNGGTPADATHWHTLMDAVVLAEKAIHDTHVTIVEAIGYAAGSDVPVASKVYSTAGTCTPASGAGQAGEVAALTRYATAGRTTKNHPIYLFNYYHRVTCNGGTPSTIDSLDTTMKSAMNTYAASWISGFSDGSITAVRASPEGQVATGSLVEEFVTHRDFPYTTSV